MCGIAGIAGIESGVSRRRSLHRMVEALAHRGPDADGEWEAPGVALGHRRLAIIDLSEKGRQPMHSHDGRFTIVFNGEIYNYKSIRQELPEFRFESDSDTEVLLAAYAKWGKKFLEKLNGMFALAIWDNRTQTLFVARDRMGIKPFYYRLEGGELWFASEIRALIQGGAFQPHLNQAALGDFIRYQTVSNPETMLDGVMSLPAGAYGVFHAGKFEIQRYWEAARAGHGFESGMSEAAVKARIRELLMAGVERRLISDVPLGAFLSGGIDSTAIVGLMSEVSNGPVDTFSVVFEEKEFDESQWSEMAAKKFNTRHHPILLKPTAFLEELPNALAAMDHPSGDGVNSYVVSKVTREQGITVALSGLGGDELFAGYPFFRQLAELQNKKILKALPFGMRKMMAGLANVIPGGRRGEKIADVLRTKDTSLASIFPVYRRVFSGALANTVLSPQKQGQNAVEHWLETYRNDWQKLPLLSQVSSAEIENYMQHILLRDTDQMSMAHALEVRVPFLDHKLVEFVLSVPDSMKYPTYPKKLLVESLGDLLPDELVNRKKMGFTFPWELWLRNELSGFCREKLEFLESTEIFLPGSLIKLHERFTKQDNTVIWAHIWLLVILGDWMERNGVKA